MVFVTYAHSSQRLAAIHRKKNGIGCAPHLFAAGCCVGHFYKQTQQDEQHLFLRFSRERAKGADELLSGVAPCLILVA